MVSVTRLLLQVKAASKIQNMKPLKLSDYDVVALDFDNTLIQYNLTNLFQAHYSCLSQYLIEKKSYHRLQNVMEHGDIDFIRRGLFMDFKYGNVLDISSEGCIINASHGTKKLNKKQIADIYGKEMKWSIADYFLHDKMALWNGVASEHTRSFLDYSDVTGTLVFAKVIDLVDKNKKYVSQDYVKMWLDLLDAIINMYVLDSDFTNTVLVNMSTYIHKCDSYVIDFLKKLKQNCKLLLITGSPQVIVDKIANYAIGSDWENLFHTIVYNAKKPVFFTGSNSFLDTNSKKIKLNASKGHYQRGNWSEMYKILEQEIGRPAKCVYFGDNVMQDVYAPFIANSPMDSVAVIDETLTEGYFKGEHSHHDYLLSRYWGSYFGDGNKTTFMADIITACSKLCIPSMSYIASKPLDFEHVPFWVYK